MPYMNIQIKALLFS